MARFSGTPVEDQPRKPRFGGKPVEEPGFLQKAWETVKPGLTELTDLSNASDVMRKGVDVVSLGLADYLGGGDQAKLTQEATARLGGGAPIVDIGAGFLTPTGVPQKLGRGAQILGHGISGGAQNIANEWTHGERDPGDLAWAGVTGSGLSAAGSAIADPIASLWSKRKAVKALPSAEDVKAEGKAGYKAVKDLGGAYHRDDTRQLFAELQNVSGSPQIDALRGWLKSNWEGKDLAPDKLDQMRRIIRKKLQRADIGDQFAGDQIVRLMDKFAENAPVTGPTGVDIPGVNDTLKAARSRYHDYIRSKEVEKAAPRKEGWLNAFGESSEAPSVNRFKKLNTRGYTQAEKDAVESLGKPGKVRSAGEIARKVSPFRSGLGAIAGLGTLAGIPFAGVGPALGLAATEGVAKLGSMATKAEIDNLQSLIKTGKGITADPVAVARARDAAARLAASLTRTGYNQFGGPR